MNRDECRTSTRTDLDEFFRIVFRTNLYESVERPYQGCRNIGRRRIATVNQYLDGVKREIQEYTLTNDYTISVRKR